jgi:hypothetical protein
MNHSISSLESNIIPNCTIAELRSYINMDICLAAELLLEVTVRVIGK